jgi:hypothetical protein
MSAEEQVLQQFSLVRGCFAALSIFAFVGIAVPWMGVATGAAPGAPVLVDVALAAILAFQSAVVLGAGVAAWVWVQILVPVTVAPGKIRFPFRRNRDRRGWRSLEEILFIGSDPTPEAVLNAQQALERMRGKPRRIGTTLLGLWKRHGQTLVLAEADALRVKLANDVARAVEEHWRRSLEARAS